MRDSFLSFSPVDLGEEEIAAVVEALRSGWITTGPRTKRFENEFSAYLKAPGALALNSCTAALHTALLVLGIGPGDEVVTTPMTFTSSVNVIEHVGATPVLVDVESDTLNISPKEVERAVTPRTKAILPVHYGGHPADLDALHEIAAPRGIAILEDAAHAFPAHYKGSPIGSGQNPVAFSFYATKNLTTGEGGMLTAAPEFLERAKVVSMHGMSRDAWKRYDVGGSWFYEVVMSGFKYNMSDIQAALGLAQLSRIEALQGRRRQIVDAYHGAFKGQDALELPVERPDVGHAWHLYPLRLNLAAITIGRGRFIEEMTERKIGTSVHFIPIHLHPYYRDRYGYAPDAFPIALDNYERLITIPLAPALSDEDVGDVIDAVLNIVERYRR
jgi:dTDP-4-amino-4,6-dideoxygalactose transaminase